MITNTVGIFGPVAAGFLCNLSFLGRRYTMVIGALCCMAFFFAYTVVRTPEQNIAFTCMIYFFVNIYCTLSYWSRTTITPTYQREANELYRRHPLCLHS